MPRLLSGGCGLLLSCTQKGVIRFPWIIEIREEKKKPIKVFYLSSCQYKIPFFRNTFYSCVLSPDKMSALKFLNHSLCGECDQSAVRISGRTPSDFSSSWIRTAETWTHLGRYLISCKVLIYRSVGDVQGLSVLVAGVRQLEGRWKASDSTHVAYW